MSVRFATLLRHVEQMRDAFDFTKGRLADDVAECAAGAIFDYMETETDPDGRTWADLSERYSAWKEAHFPGQPMALLHGRMRTPEQLHGELAAAPDTLVQTYGRDEEAKTLAEWFSEGNSEQNRPARPFYQFNPLALSRLEDLFTRRLRDATR